MPTVKILPSGPASYTVMGQRFERGVKRNATPQLASYLRSRRNEFRDHFSIDLHEIVEDDLPPGPQMQITDQEAYGVLLRREAARVAAAAPLDTGAARLDDAEIAVEAVPKTVHEALGLIDLEDDSNFEADTRPTTAALTLALGRIVTEEERDEAFPPMDASGPPATPRVKVIKRARAATDSTTNDAVEA